ncbi:uncharacterized protein LOC144569423 [Carex rostrata]
MGCNNSRPKIKKFDCVRVVHINGYVEDYDGPVTASHVMGKSVGRYVLCSSSKIFYSGTHACKPGDPLEPGRIYFLLPISILQSEASPADYVCLMNRLTSLAKKGGSRAKGPSMINSILDQAGYESPTRACDGTGAVSGNGQADLPPDREFVTGSGKWCSRSGWKPCLDRIDESFRRSMRMDSMRSNIGGGEVEILDNGNEVGEKIGENIGVIL